MEYCFNSNIVFFVCRQRDIFPVGHYFLRLNDKKKNFFRTLCGYNNTIMCSSYIPWRSILLQSTGKYMILHPVAHLYNIIITRVQHMYVLYRIKVGRYNIICKFKIMSYTKHHDGYSTYQVVGKILLPSVLLFIR